MKGSKQQIWSFFRWCAGHWLGVLGTVFGLVGIIYGIRANLPRQELSYRLNRSFEVFNAEEDQQFRMVVKCPDTNSTREKLDGVEEIIEYPNIIFDGNHWRPIKTSIEAFEIEIQNSGSEPLWYKDQPNDACPICIKTNPLVEILDAYVIQSHRDKNGFKTVRNEQWNNGRVECQWKCLANKESVAVRVIHLKPKKKIEVSLEGELRENLMPKRIKSPKIPTLEQSSFWRAMFVYVFIMCIVLLISLSAFLAGRAWRTWRSDIELFKTGVVPEGVVPRVKTYWRRYFILQLWILFFIIVLVIFVFL